MNDRQIDTAAFRRGDVGVFRNAVEGLSPRLLPALMSFTGDRDEAHDLMQDVWRRAYAKRTTFSGTGTLLGWLLAIARSVAVNSVRKEKSRDRFVPEPELHTGAAPTPPDEALERRELSRAVHRALLDLPERERDVVVLRMLEQLSTRETAARLGCAEGTVKAALHSALKKLRTPMEIWTT